MLRPFSSSSRLTMPSSWVCSARGSVPREASPAMRSSIAASRCDSGVGAPWHSERVHAVGYFLQLLREGAELGARSCARASPAPPAAPASGRGASPAARICGRDKLLRLRRQAIARAGRACGRAHSISRRAAGDVLRADRFGRASRSCGVSTASISAAAPFSCCSIAAVTAARRCSSRASAVAIDAPALLEPRADVGEPLVEAASDPGVRPLSPTSSTRPPSSARRWSSSAAAELR